MFSVINCFFFLRMRIGIVLVHKLLIKRGYQKKNKSNNFHFQILFPVCFNLKNEKDDILKRKTMREKRIKIDDERKRRYDKNRNLNLCFMFSFFKIPSSYGLRLETGQSQSSFLLSIIL